jgi:GTP-binding protein EngB required for normal cell division
VPFLLVLTKSDLVSRVKLSEISAKIRSLYALDEDEPIIFSSSTGTGKRELWKAVRKSLLEDSFECEDEAAVLEGE